jgi:adenine-specific DNA-methyltransferase
MPILNWLTRETDLQTSLEVPYRLLEPVADLGAGDLSENMLIQGDNLEALKSLLPFYAGKIKCIYIDPPYNTKSAFEHYDDNLEHTKWLAMMYPRLELLRDLLSESGSIWVSIDDNEGHYLRVIMDEIFGRDKFVADITYERSGSAGLGQGGEFVRNSEHLLIYKKGDFVFNDVLASSKIEPKTMKRYNKVVVNEGSKELVREFVSKSNGMPVKVYKHTSFEIKSISLANFEKREKEIKAEYIEHFPNIFRTNNVQKENEFQNDLMSGMDKSHLYTVEYTPNRGKHNGNLTTLYYYNSELFAWLKDTAYIDDDGEIVKTNKLTTVWAHGDIPKADLANEGEVDFPRSKKPEQLIRRILLLATNPNDIVLDSFLGSGTTAAVAHKMGRRYIGIEMGGHSLTHCVPRLKRVVEGEQGGISKAENWKGGGGYRFYRLGEPIFDEHGKINPGIRFAHLASHIWFCETHTALDNPTTSPLLGVFNGVAYYLLYNGILGDKRPDGGNVLTNPVLRLLPPFDGPKVIYGESSRLGAEKLKALGITFKQTPYDIKAR